MNILDRYCTKEFLRYFFLILSAFVSVYLIIDLFGKIRMFISNHATVYQVVSFFFFSTPMFIMQILPIGVLVASLISFISLSRHNELMAMKASGINIYRTTWPVIAIAILLCFLEMIVSEYVTPYTNQKADYIKLADIQKQEIGTFQRNQIWYRGKEGIYNFRVFDPRTNSLQGITIYFVDNKLHLLKRLDAERGEWRDGKWVFYNLIATTFTPGTFPEMQVEPSEIMTLPETPENFKSAQRDADNMGYLELRRYIADLKAEGYDASSYVVDLDAKLALPFVSLIMAILGIASVLRGEGRGKTQGLALGLAVGFSYWLVFSFTVSLGRAGVLPPLLAAWSANLLVGLLAGFLFLKIRT